MKFLAGEILDADRLNDALGSLVHKPANTTTLSTATTLVADPHLTLPLASNSVYLAVLSVTLSSPAASDIKWDFVLPNSATMPNYQYIITGGTGAIAAHTDVPIMATSGSIEAIILRGTVFTAATAGFFVWRWASNVSGAGNTVVYQGGSLTLHKVT